MKAIIIGHAIIQMIETDGREGMPRAEAFPLVRLKTTLELWIAPLTAALRWILRINKVELVSSRPYRTGGFNMLNSNIMFKERVSYRW